MSAASRALNALCRPRFLYTRQTPASRRRAPLRLEELEQRALPTLMSNSLFPADNPWNEKITNAPVAANSSVLVGSIGLNSALHADFGTVWAGALNGIPYNVVPGSQAKINVVIDAFASESDVKAVPIPAGALIEGDPLSSAQNKTDRHLIVYDQDNNIVYELYNTHRPSEESDNQWHADSKAVWDLNKNTFRAAGFTSADAAGLPILPGLVRPDEVLTQGAITHALRFTVPATDDAYVYPASHEAGVDNSALPLMGQRFRLKANVDISSFPADDRVILQALKDYGMIVADNGSPWYLSGAPSALWSDSDLHLLGSLTGSDFEAVDLTPSVTSVSPTSGSASGGTTVVINGVNLSGGAGLTHVLFGGVDAGAVQVISDSQLRVTAPAHAAGSVVDVTVVSPYGTSNKTASDRFIYTTGGGPAAPDPVFALGLDGSLSQIDVTSGTTLLSPAGTILSVSSVADSAGHYSVFAVTADHHLWRYASGAWSYLSAGAFQQLSAATNKSGAAVVFAVLADASLWEYGSQFVGGWAMLSPAGTILSVSAVTDASGNDTAYAITADRQLWRRSPTAWTLLSTGSFLSINAGRNGAGQAVAFGVLTDHSLWENNPAFTGGWQLLSAAGSILSVSGGGPDEVFAITADHHLWDHRTSGWALMSAGSFLSIAATANAAGQGEAFATLADSSLWEYNPVYTSTPWLNLAAASVQAASAPRR